MKKHLNKFAASTCVSLYNSLVAFKIVNIIIVAAEEQLLKDLDEFEKTLNHAENHLTTKASPEAPIKETLVTLGVCELDDKLIRLIPDSILTNNYVEFRLTLRK